MIGILPWLGFGGYSIGTFFQELANFGFFAYVLPFILIFATVFAILTKVDIFKDNKGANIIVAMAVGLLALQFSAVPDFFSIIFSNLGIGISIILALLILAGVFLDTDESGTKWILFGVGGVVFLAVTFISLSDWNYAGAGYFKYWWSNYGGLIFFVAALIGVIIAVAKSGGRGATAKTPAHP